MSKDWVGNSRSVYGTLGASNHVNTEREKNDYYATSPITVEQFLNAFGDILPKVWEPSCGGGHISEVLKKHGCDVLSTDLIDRGYGIGGIDFFKVSKDDKFLTDWSKGLTFDIFTNPPYKYAEKYVLHALDLLPEGGRLIMFLKTSFLEGKSRKKNIYDVNPPRWVYQYSARQGCAINGDFEGTFGSVEKAGGAVAYAMYVWYKHNDEKITQVRWI